MAKTEDSVRNHPSILLTEEENESLFNLLGPRRQTKATGIIQVFTTQAPKHDQWIKGIVGAVCIVKDNILRSYYFRLYCLFRNSLLWEQEMYDDMVIEKPKPFMILFEGDNSMVAFNFANETEAETFYNTAKMAVYLRAKRKDEQKVNGGRATLPRHSHSSRLNDVTQKSSTLDRKHQGKSEAKATKSVRKEKKKFSKSDIGMPSDFQHLSHVGWSADEGLSMTGDGELNKFLQDVGVTAKMLRNPKTAAIVDNFLKDHQDEIKQNRTTRPLPPVPLAQPKLPKIPDEEEWPAPPPSLITTRLGPGSKINQTAPLTPNNGRKITPKRSQMCNSEYDIPPPHMNIRSAASNAPPPPPMAPMASPMAPIAPPLINSGSATKSLRTAPVQPAKPDPRSALLSAIQAGKALKSVTISTENNDVTPRGNDLADVLRRALSGRNNAIHSDSSDDSEDNDGDEDWD